MEPCEIPAIFCKPQESDFYIAKYLEKNAEMSI
jgi:hypothetical protein